MSTFEAFALDLLENLVFLDRWIGMKPARVGSPRRSAWMEFRNFFESELGLGERERAEDFFVRYGSREKRWFWDFEAILSQNYLVCRFWVRRS